jgi:ribosomal protein S18 acetylase RimI-like enzyme
MKYNERHVTVMPMDQDHVGVVVDIHMATFPGFFLSFLGRRFLSLYYHGILRSADGIGLISVSENAVSGFVTGFVNPSGFYKRLLKSDWFRFGMASVPALVKKPSVAFRLLRAFLKSAGAPQGEAVELSSLAVSPGEQGKGTGRILVAAFLQEAVRKAGSYVYLTTDARENARVNEFYQQQGFQLVRTYVTPEKRQMCEYRYFLVKRT